MLVIALLVPFRVEVYSEISDRRLASSLPASASNPTSSPALKPPPSALLNISGNFGVFL